MTPFAVLNNVPKAVLRMVAAELLPMLEQHLLIGRMARSEFLPFVSDAGFSATIEHETIICTSSFGGEEELPPSGSSLAKLTHCESCFAIPDVSKVLAVPELLPIYMLPGVIAMAERIDQELADQAVNFTENITVGAAGVTLTERDIDGIECALFKRRAPMTLPRFLVVDHEAYSSLRQHPRFKEYLDASLTDLRGLISGPVGRYKSLWIVQSNCLRKTGSGPHTTHGMAFARTGLGWATRRLEPPDEKLGVLVQLVESPNIGLRVMCAWRPETLQQHFTIDILFGAAVLRNAHGIHVIS